MENENKKYSPYPDKEDKINELKEKIEYQTEQKKSTVQKILDKYHTKGSMSTSMRMPVESNSIYLSERVPFCEEKIEKDKILARKSSYKTTDEIILLENTIR